VLIQIRPDAAGKSSSKRDTGDMYIGTLAVIGVATLSGLAGIYFEYILKGNIAFTMWDRNIQLSLYGIIFGLISIPLSSDDFLFFQQHNFFYGWTWWTLAVVLLASLGGLLVSIAVAYTDNILKNFATSAAILLTSLISYSIFGDLTPDIFFCCGTTAVLLAVFNYNEDVKQLAKQLGMIDMSPLGSSGSSNTSNMANGTNRLNSNNGQSGGISGRDVNVNVNDGDDTDPDDQDSMASQPLININSENRLSSPGAHLNRHLERQTPLA
jgi:UDP-galactose transporter